MVSTPPPVLPILDIPATGTQVRHPFFALTLGLKHKKLDCSPSSTPEGQSSKWAHTGTEEGSISSGHSTLPIQQVFIHSPEQLKPQLVNLSSSPVKPNDSLAAEAFGSTIDHDRDYAVEVIRDDANKSGDQSHSSSDSQESAADAGPKSATGDFLMCSDIEKTAINSTHKKFQKKVSASCNITKDCLWLEAQLKWIGDSPWAVWESNYEVFKTEWELALKEDHNSFEVNKMMVRTNQLL